MVIHLDDDFNKVWEKIFVGKTLIIWATTGSIPTWGTQSMSMLIRAEFIESGWDFFCESNEEKIPRHNPS